MNPFAQGKVLHHPDRLADWAHSGDCWPVTVELDMTNACTDKCPCCAGGRERKSANMDIEAAKRALDELSQVGARAVIFTGGGEPLCHKDTPEAILYARDLAFDIGLITNGVLLDAKVMRDALNACIWVRVSLDANDAAMYRTTHGTENFDRVVRNIGELSQLDGLTDVGVGYLVDSRTLDGMVEATALCRDLGVDYLQFRPFHHAAFEPELARKVWTMFGNCKDYERDGFSVVWSEAKFNAMLEGTANRPYTKCYGHSMAAVIGADGNVYLCCHMRGNEKYVLGNIYEDSFPSIWTSERRAKAIDGIDFDDCPLLCRCDSMNRTLWSMKHNPPKHVNFL